MVNKFFVLAWGILCFFSSISAQVKNAPDFSVARIGDTLSIDYTASPQPFRLSIGGKDLTFKRNGSSAVTVNTAVGPMMVRFVEKEDFADLSKKLTDEEVLLAHREWFNWKQAAEVGGRMKATDGPPESLSVSDPGSSTQKSKTLRSLSWTSGLDKQPKRNLYRTALVGNVVLMIAIPYDRDEKIGDARAVTQKVLASITLLAKAASPIGAGDDIDEFLEMAENNGVSRDELRKTGEEYTSKNRLDTSAAQSGTAKRDSVIGTSTLGDALSRQADIAKRETAYRERIEAFKKAYWERFSSAAAIQLRIADGYKNYINGAELARFLAFRKETEAFLAEYRDHLSRSESILRSSGKQDAVDAVNASIKRLNQNLEWLNGELSNYSSI